MEVLKTSSRHKLDISVDSHVFLNYILQWGHIVETVILHPSGFVCVKSFQLYLTLQSRGL